MRTQVRREGSPQARRSRPRALTRPLAPTVAAVPRPDVLTPADVLDLQSTLGNMGVRELLRPSLAKRSPVLDVVGSGSGEPLESSVRQLMESRFGHDLGAVRVHRDARATESARAVRAHAYTVGNDVVFQRDLYRPHTTVGRRMLAHELAHVIQQRSGPVAGTPAPGGIKISDPTDAFEQEAERLAARALGPGGADGSASSQVEL